MKKLIFAVIVMFLVFGAFSAGCKNNNPESPAATATPVPPADTPTPVATVLVDNFEDGDMVNSITPLDAAHNTWGSFWDSSASVVSSQGICGAPGSEYGADPLGNTVDLVAKIATPTAQYVGFCGPYVNIYTNFGTSTGFNFSDYSGVKFGMYNSVVTAPLNGSLKYSVQLYNGMTGYMARAEFTPPSGQWSQVYVPFSNFTVPVVSYGTVPKVLSKVTQFAIYYEAYAPVSNTPAELHTAYDNIRFEKYRSMRG